MAVNMAYVPKPEKMTPPWNDSADIAVTSEKKNRQPFFSAYSV
jgi:hypothetical protein